MEGEWQTVKLKDVANDITVGFVGSMSKLFVEKGIPLLRGQNILPYKLALDNLKYISPETQVKWQKSSLNAGDVVIVRVGHPGIACVIPENMGELNAASLVIVKPNSEKIDSDFLCYFLNSKIGQAQISSYIVGSVQQVFNVKTAAELEIPCPSLAEQKRIARILSNLTNKIELNRQTNPTLEKIAQAIFKSWFVDFEPVKAKAIVKEKGGNELAQSLAAQAIICGVITLDQLQELENDYRGLEAQIHPLITKRFPNEIGLDYWSPETLQTTAALFSDALVESELGEIPEGWGVGIIGDLFELHRGFDLPKNDRKDGAYPVYASGGYHGQHAEFKMEPPGIITGRSGVIGNVYLSLTKYWPLNTTLYVREFKRCGPYYAYFFLNMCDLKSLNSGSAVPSLNRNFVHSVNALIPDDRLLDMFENITKSSFIKIKSNDIEIELLSSLRDLLLLKLLSGGVSQSNNNHNMEVAANG